MENASKALIMAAEILLGVMIISIGVFLFNTMGQYSDETSDQIEQAQLEQFNNQFLKYYGNSSIFSGGTDPITEPIRCTIHDIVNLANLANMYNIQNGFEVTEDISDNPENNPLYYIQIDLRIDGEASNAFKNLEGHEWSQDRLIDELMKVYNLNIADNDGDGEEEAEIKYFRCSEAVISNVTKRVCYMKFVEY